MSKTMKKLRNKISIAALCIGIVILLCMSMFVFFNFEKSNVALAADTTATSAEELAKTYTDSDTVYGSNKTIQQYPSSLYQTKTRISSGKLVISADDPIVNIVPQF